MLIKVIKKQTIFLLKQKEASLTFILLLAVVLGNYITNFSHLEVLIFHKCISQ